MGKLTDALMDFCLDWSDKPKLGQRLIEAGIANHTGTSANRWIRIVDHETGEFELLDYTKDEEAIFSQGYIYVGPGEPNVPVARIPQMVEALRRAGNQFDFYARNHMAKGPGHEDKANVNVEYAATVFKALGEPYLPPVIAQPDQIHGAEGWKQAIRADSSPVEAESGVPVGGSAKTILKVLYVAESGGTPMMGVSLHLDDRPILDTLVELGYVNRGEVDDKLSVTTKGKDAIGVRPDGVPDIPVEVASVTGNTEEKELAGRYIDAKIKGVEAWIAKNPAAAEKHDYEIMARVLGEIAYEFRIGMHLPAVVIDGRVIPYNEDRSTGFTHAEALQLFFNDVYARNVKAGWWNNIEDGTPKKRNVGELFMLMVTELAEAYEAYVHHAPDDKLPHHPGLGVELGDLLIRIADFCGAVAEGNVIEFDPGSHNPGAAMFIEVCAIADRYESIRKTPAAVGDTEVGDFIPAMQVGVMVDEKLSFNAKREDHKIENRLKEDGKKT